MTVNHVLNFSSLIVLFLLLTSCGILGSDSDKDDTEELVDGLSQDIWELIDEDLLSVMEDSLAVPVHRGDNPPDILKALSGSAQKEKAIYAEGAAVIMRPFVMLETLVPDDRCADNNCSWYNLYVLFNQQDFETNEVTIRMRHVEEPEITGTDGFISGNGENFSVFVEQIQDFDGRIVKMVSLFSGKVTPEGIKDPHLAGVMVDNADVEGRIPNGTGRSYKDGDDLAETDEWPETDDSEKIISKTSAATGDIFRRN